MKSISIILILVSGLFLLSSCKDKTTEPNQVELPTFSLAAGTYAYAPSVYVNCATPDVTIYYTVDGSTPSSTSATSIPMGTPRPVLYFETTTTIKVIAYKEGWNPSAVATATYTVNISTPAQNMILVSGGTFNPSTTYTVTLSPFYISNFELTQEEYLAVMGVNPSFFTLHVKNPVEQVSWFNAVEYCNRKSMLRSLTPCYSYSTYGTDPASWPTGWNVGYNNQDNISCNWAANGYRLPTEMEWMFAAKGGNLSQNYNFAGGNDPQAIGWMQTTTNNNTQKVGLKTPNELGLYDMSGNVTEWVWDQCSSVEDYPTATVTDPRGLGTGIWRMDRGGCYSSETEDCTLVHRTGTTPDAYGGWGGFRVCRSTM